jgi:hypothetical protein
MLVAISKFKLWASSSINGDILYSSKFKQKDEVYKWYCYYILIQIIIYL